MNCCVNCFTDEELRGIIAGQGNVGSCDFCGSRGVNIYDTNDSKKIISELLYSLVSVYTTLNALQENFKREDTDLLKNILYRDWNIFNLSPQEIYRLVIDVCSDKYEETPELFDAPIGLSQLMDSEYLSSNSLLRNYTWETFVTSIKTENRFHSDHFNKEILESVVSHARKKYAAGAIFYRARISTSKQGYTKDNMWSPPASLAKAGRVNSEGISVLYLANSIDTAVYEVRAGRYDYICIGTFELLKDMEIISFDLLKTISPFIYSEGDNILQLAVNLPHISRLVQDVARPLRRYDSTLDYIPTQYLSDFIKSQPGISGITYRSSMAEDGINVAAFDSSKFRCTDVKVLEISGLQYNWKEF